MKNKKGFTLTEILATIVILGVILAIAVPSYNALSKKFEKEYYDNVDITPDEIYQVYYDKKACILYSLNGRSSKRKRRKIKMAKDKMICSL